MQNSGDLLVKKKFWPLFLTQFFGAFNDNIFKNALVIFIAFVAVKDSEYAEILVTLVAFLFILPYFLFSALAGQIADKYNKAAVIRIVKIVEIIVMSFAGLAFYVENVAMLLFTLFLMGAQSTFFSPLKYGIIPELVKKDEVLPANGLVSASTFIAILLGTIIGGLLVLEENGLFYIIGLTIFCAIIGYFTSRSIFDQKSADNIEINYNIVRQSLIILKAARQKREIFLSIIGISWCWFLGSIFLSQFPNYAKNLLNANNEVVTLFLTMFSIGVAVGSFLCNRLLKGEVSAELAPFSLLFVTIFTLDLYFATLAYEPLTTEMFLGFDAFIVSIGSYRIMFDMFMIAVFAGIYIVPLYSLIQAYSDDSNRARIIAALNIYDSSFMVISAIMAVSLFAFKFNSVEIFLVTGIINLVFMVIACDLSHKSRVEAIFWPILRIFNKLFRKK